MHKDFSGRGFEIFAFPCNQFGGQEPGTPEEIESVLKKYGAKFPTFEKIDVNGINRHPLYEAFSGSTGLDVNRNFVKFLVNGNGKIAGFYNSKRDPVTIFPDIEKLLA